MYCTNCGAPNAADAAFCTTCGTPLTPPVQEQAPPAEQFQAAPPPPPPAPPQAYAQPVPQQQVQQPYPAQPQYGYPPQAPPAKKKNKGLVIGIVAGVAVLVIALVLILVLGGGGGGKGISGRWTVVDADDWAGYDKGLIFNFKSNGTLVFEAPKDATEDEAAMYSFMNLMKTTYKVSGDKLILTAEFFGEKDESEMRFELDGDTLKLYDGSETTVLKRTK